MNLTIVDVFAEARYEGNQLAVVRGAGSLDTRAMQKLARETNFSETTFVTEEADGRARVRIFTPNEELPFAGHPTLGTAWVLAHDRPGITLELGVGDIGVSFEAGITWMLPPPVDVEPLSALEAARLAGLDASALDPELGCELLECGPRFAFVGVKDGAALARARAVLGEDDPAIFVVCRGGYSADADFAARMFFFDGSGTREDPATGSANAAFAQRLLAKGRQGRFVVEQGFAIGRPSRLYLDVGQGAAGRVRVGGKVVPVLEGRLV